MRPTHKAYKEQKTYRKSDLTFGLALITARM